jgi:molecular chaperone DnaJ
MPTTRDYYEILGVEKGADADDVKRAYRRLAMKHHPDRNPGDAEAEARFKEAAEAYEILSDPQKRQRYDQFGHEGVRGAAAGGATHDFSRMNVEDIFSMFEEVFGGGMGGGGFGRAGGARSRRGPARGYDLETDVSIELEDVLSGAEREVQFTRMDVCETCGGDGCKPGSSPTKCGTCAGQGRVMQAGLGGMFRIATQCPACGGRGEIITDPCEACQGKGRTARKRSLTVKIPAGVHDGQAVRVRGEGEPPRPEESPKGEGLRGDLHVVIRVSDHELFRREGDHLVLELPIGFSQAALGGELEIPTLEGSRELKIPKGTQHGAVLKLSGEGLPNLRTGQRGDLAVITRIDVPKKLTDEQERLLREYAETEDVTVSTQSGGIWKRIRDALGA